MIGYTPSMTQINKAQSILGEKFWTRVATTKTMQEYYKDYKGSPRFWQSPFIENNTDKKHQRPIFVVIVEENYKLK